MSRTDFTTSKQNQEGDVQLPPSPIKLGGQPGIAAGRVPTEILAAAHRGWKVFPIKSGTKKRPLIKWIHGDHPASSDIDQIRRWTLEHPGCNWGCATGSRSGIFVVDTDSFLAWAWLQINGIPDTYTVKTGKNDLYAYHYYFRQPSGTKIKTAAGIRPGLDVRGDGGMVLIPPSIHPVSGKTYAVANSWDIAEAPAWLISLIRDDKEERLLVPCSERSTLSHDDQESGRDSFLKACKNFAALAAGTGVRNSALNKLGFMAGGLIASGCIDLQFAQTSVLKHAANYIAQDGQRAVMKTFESGMKAGLSHPWQPLKSRPEDAGFGKSPLPVGALALPSMPPVEKSPTGLAAAIHLLALSAVDMKPIRWLWPDWLPIGKLVIYAGPGGIGKSTVTLSWAAVVSSGGSWPDGTKCSPGNVLIWSGEDDCEDTIAPRLSAMGANLDRVHMIKGSKDLPFDPARDVKQLRAQFAQGEVSLLIIDPIVSAITGDMNKANEVRRGLQELVNFAGEISCCVVGITHFTKSSAGKNPTERVTGSQTFTAFSRVTLVGQKDQQEDKCVIARSKSNISIDRGGFSYRIKPATLNSRYGPLATTRIDWLGAVEGGAQEILENLEPVEGSTDGGKLKKAEAFLAVALKEGFRPQKHLEEECGVSPKTLKRAKKNLGIKSIQSHRGWHWALPSDSIVST